MITCTGTAGPAYACSVSDMFCRSIDPRVVVFCLLASLALANVQTELYWNCGTAGMDITMSKIFKDVTAGFDDDYLLSKNFNRHCSVLRYWFRLKPMPYICGQK